MIETTEFSSIRPFRDEEVPEVMHRLVQDPMAFKLMKYLFPRLTEEQLKERAEAVRCIRDLQKNFSYPALRGIIAKTTHGLTHEGFEHLKSGRNHLILSNHRDILLDSGFLNVLLFDEGLDTVETGTGDNLFISEFISTLMRLNRTFVIHRTAPRNEMYDVSLRLSHYIRRLISEAKASVWIAQRNGRTKDGNDRTEPGLLKMFSLSHNDFIEGFAELGITPMAISYEYDPCDALKVQERYYAQVGHAYDKTRKDDLKGMLTGVTDHKGKVHLAIGEPIGRETLEKLARIDNRNERLREFAALIDQIIYRQYKLWAVHFVAADLVEGTNTYASHYTPDQQKAFCAYVEQRLEDCEGDRAILRKLMLEIYANPVKNRFFS